MIYRISLNVEFFGVKLLLSNRRKMNNFGDFHGVRLFVIKINRVSFNVFKIGDLSIRMTRVGIQPTSKRY